MKSTPESEVSEFLIPAWIEAEKSRIPRPPVQPAKLVARGFFWACVALAMIEAAWVMDGAHQRMPHYALLALAGAGMFVSGLIMFWNTNAPNEDSSKTYDHLLQLLALNKSSQNEWTASQLGELKTTIAYEHQRLKAEWESVQKTKGRPAAFFITLAGHDWSADWRSQIPPEVRYLELLAGGIENIFKQRQRAIDEQAKEQAKIDHERKETDLKADLGQSLWNYRAVMMSKIDRVAERDFWEWSDVGDLLRHAGMRCIEMATMTALQVEAPLREEVWKQSWDENWRLALLAAQQTQEKCRKHLKACDHARTLGTAFFVKCDEMPEAIKSDWLTKLKRIGDEEDELGRQVEEAMKELRNVIPLKL